MNPNPICRCEYKYLDLLLCSYNQRSCLSIPELNKFLSKLQIEHAIQQAKCSSNKQVKSVFKDDGKPDKLAHIPRFGEWVKEYIVRTVLKFFRKHKEYE